MRSTDCRPPVGVFPSDRDDEAQARLHHFLPRLVGSNADGAPVVFNCALYLSGLTAPNYEWQSEAGKCISKFLSRQTDRSLLTAQWHMVLSWRMKSRRE